MVEIVEDLDLVSGGGAAIGDDDVEAGEVADFDLLGRGADDLHGEIGARGGGG